MHLLDDGALQMRHNWAITGITGDLLHKNAKKYKIDWLLKKHIVNLQRFSDKRTLKKG